MSDKVSRGGKVSGGVPRHVAIIMDGNGRWAKKRALKRTDGHRAGAKAARRTTKAAAEMGIEFLTLYAFSSENWLRPKSEVFFLMRLLRGFLDEQTEDLVKNNIRLVVIGRMNKLPGATRRAVARAERETAACRGMTLCMALSYSGTDEIVDAARALAQDAAGGVIKPEAITRSMFERKLYYPDMPPVDLLIRTAGEKRISNFLLWQGSYAELWFTRTLWPDFGKGHLAKAIEDYRKRERTFGRVGSARRRRAGGRRRHAD